MLIDTHTHIYLPEFDDDRDAVMARAAEAGVALSVLPGVDENSIAPMRLLHSRYPKATAMAPGIHPTELRDDWRRQVDVIAEELALRRADYVAVGEIGIDLHWDTSTLKRQCEAFDAQVGLALEHDLPIIIHSRDALSETLSVLRRFASEPRLRGVFHSFPGTPDDVAAIDAALPGRQFFFGINGVVTFKNSRLRESLPAIGLERLVVETDAPWLSPTPLRGRRNEPANVALTARFIADSLGLPFDAVADATTANARRLFSLLTESMPI